ncbi:MAG TPA: O-phospho-L-seryl-tRNA:Cys-tRNA synthase, partial [Methanomicrobiales archaeon]|nr:O-phospho-L-seryl-tRNA:Cys-tRNA synthase [Methanomicrobiales archaeon]
MKCSDTIEVRELDELYINLDPIQAGGRLTPEAMKAVIAYGDGYSVCDFCRKPFRLDFIEKPPVNLFHKELAQWLNMDAVRLVAGARRGFQAVAHTYLQKGDAAILTALSHYTEFLAVEGTGAIPREIPKTSGNIITADAAAEKIEEVTKELKKPPAL